jgi:hypothetical protein
MTNPPVAETDTAMTDYPVDSSNIRMGDPSGMDLTAMFAAIDAGRIADVSA